MTCRAADSTNLQCYHSETVERSSLDEHVPFSKVSLQGLRASAPRTYTLQARDTDSPNRGRTTIAALRQPFEKHRKFSLNLAADLGLETSRTSAVSRASSQRDGTGAL